MTRIILVACFITALSARAADKPALSFDLRRTAVVITDPQNDFLDERGVAYGLFAANLKAVGTIENLDKLMKAAKKHDVPLVISPHIYLPTDQAWKNPGALQKQLLSLHVFLRTPGKHPEGTGPEFLARYQPLLNDGQTVVTSPHKVFGPESNDLLLQLRARNIDTVILGGLAANLCTEAHLRALAENGFRVFVVKDAVAAPGAEAYQAALVNFALIANGVLSTEEALAALTASHSN